MKKLVFVLIMMCFIPAFGFTDAMAGEIYGTIEDAGKPVPADVEVKLTVGATENISVKTDKLGAYRAIASNKGKGVLTIVYKNRVSEPADIVSFEKATRYDWTIEASGDRITLKRK
jgi:hypothetical protein